MTVTLAMADGVPRSTTVRTTTLNFEPNNYTTNINVLFLAENGDRTVLEMEYRTEQVSQSM